ncbi:MAG: trypsin-like peptidase domain-containing protein [Gemmataceae bacterium]
MRILVALSLLAGFVAGSAHAQPDVLKSQADRVAVVEKVKPSVVAIFAKGGRGGGTGVLISDDGYALTNFHVVQPTGPTMECGLPNGVLYDAVLVGLDKVGDVALIKLLPKKEGDKFPTAVLGDSDTVHEGDWSIAMGNPFLLATDFTPTVTFGLVSGVHRYQYPAGVLLEYTDCIQIDTSINPGNSGGPLFNMKGELIGINGRGSFDKRARINSGVGYAISINQIKNFMGHLKAGIDTDHASLGALVTTQTEGTGLGKMVVTSILEDSDVARRGLDFDDELVSFGGRLVTSVNHYKNVLGLYPRGWRVPLEYRNAKGRKEVLARLMGVQRKVLEEEKEKVKVEEGQPKKIMPGKNPGPQGPAAKYYVAKQGYANFYFNKVEKDRLLTSFKKNGDFAPVGGGWTMQGTVRLKKLNTDSKVTLNIDEKKSEDGKGSEPYVKLSIEAFDYDLYPLKAGQDPAALKKPEFSGGLLPAMYVWHRLMTQGEAGFSDFYHGGVEPFYPPVHQGEKDKTFAERRVDCEVVNSRFGPFLSKWFFSQKDGKILGFELRTQENEDPCEVYFSDYRAVDGRMLPHRMQVVYGEGHYGTFQFSNYNLGATPK